jgi:capsular exopolysaccharide synthesis family protein
VSNLIRLSILDSSPRSRTAPYQAAAPDSKSPLGCSGKLCSGPETWSGGAARMLPIFSSEAPLLAGDDAFAAEQYRIARTAVAQKLEPPFLLAVSSPCVGDGKTISATNLAIAMASGGQGRTLLIDADLRGAGVHSRLNIPATPGLADLLEGTATLPDAVVRDERIRSFHVLPAGHAYADPSDLFDGAAWKRLAEYIRRHFDQVVIDCPPIEMFADFDLIAGVSDTWLAVVRPNHTDRALCFAALEKLKPKLMGVLINEAEDWFLWKRLHVRAYSRYQPRGSRSAHLGKGK